MIAISWALVIVAVAALVAGIARGGFGLIVAAIAGAIGAAVALGLGLLRTSPEEDPEAVDGAAVEDEALGSEDLAGDELPRRGRGEAPGAEPDVLVLSEHGTYHVPGCRLVTDVSDNPGVPLDAARRHGFTPCDLCRPS